MLNEFLIFTAIILLPINAILIDHVSVRREILARLEKPVKLSQYSEKMINAFGNATLAAVGLSSAFSGMFSKSSEKVDILIHRGNNDDNSGCFIFADEEQASKFRSERLAPAFLDESPPMPESPPIFKRENSPAIVDRIIKRFCGVSPLSLSDTIAAVERLSDTERAALTFERKETRWDSGPTDIIGDIERAGGGFVLMDLARKRTDEARQELWDFRCSLIGGCDDNYTAIRLFKYAKRININPRDLIVVKCPQGYDVSYDGVLPGTINSIECEITFDFESEES